MKHVKKFNNLNENKPWSDYDAKDHEEQKPTKSKRIFYTPRLCHIVWDDFCEKVMSDTSLSDVNENDVSKVLGVVEKNLEEIFRREDW